ncbi:hypothetical protein [Amycolatopsis sp. FDAARGOS 1241]|uniref:hypothetical protein n=1 Tax=Amycolatopsis sp. FDAARGOS 1241 TaxID=2778070 RepID=UPI0019504957|nr:hypothetical protein [Amycolatopsis sp. FDAARGOS 1241]QRP48083.1 hypothetical protein I6J71_09470 [Amycolatopsis sp. FDAARGOS 1241]
MPGNERVRQPRTLLEQKIWERKQTLSEFVRFAEEFARQFGERGTLSERHLKRLVAGRAATGTQIGRPRPATASLLERIFGIDVDALLSPVVVADDDDSDAQELRTTLDAARRITPSIVALLQDQLASVRRLDRQLGAVTAHDEVAVKIDQVTRLLSHSLSAGVREQLAALRAELGTLAGWQALDLGRVSEAWHHYERAKQAASQSGIRAFEIHTSAEQAFVLLDLGETTAAVELLATIEALAHRKADRLLRSWLAAAHGEALAANAQRSASLRAFDRAEALLPSHQSEQHGPYVALDAVHLARWRGHALARIGEPEAVNVLEAALNDLDPTFTRAEAALRVDLATAFVARGDHEAACAHITKARLLATEVGSSRQLRRLSAPQLRNQ